MINSVQLQGLTYMRSLDVSSVVNSSEDSDFDDTLIQALEAEAASETEAADSTSTAYTNPEDLASVEVPEELEAYFTEAEETYGVPAALLKAIAKAESNFNSEAVSSAGAQGIMQLMPSTAASLGVTDCFDAEENIMGGAKYISQLLTKYNGSVKLALAAYNAGSGNVAKYGGVPPFTETQNYIKKIFSYLGVDANGNAATEVTATDTDDSDETGSTSSSSTQAIDSETASQIADAIMNSVTSSSSSSSSASSLYSSLLSSLSSSSSAYSSLLGSSSSSAYSNLSSIYSSLLDS